MSGVALITGGQRGIGFGIAQGLAQNGFRVALAAERAPDDTEVLQALDALPEASYHQHDLRGLKGITALLDQVEAQHGPLTTLISNAGIPAPVRGDMLELTPENFERVMQVNLTGGFFLAQDAARRMAERDSVAYKSLIFVTSVSADMASPERAEYCISKAAASMMVKLYAARLAEAGIGVFELRPGIIETEMTAAVRDRYETRIREGLVPARRWGAPADVARAVLPLVTGQMAYSTGTVIAVDGGLQIHRL